MELLLASGPWLLLSRPLCELALSEDLVLELLAPLADKLLGLLVALLLLLLLAEVVASAPWGLVAWLDVLTLGSGGADALTPRLGGGGLLGGWGGGGVVLGACAASSDACGQGSVVGEQALLLVLFLLEGDLWEDKK